MKTRRNTINLFCLFCAVGSFIAPVAAQDFDVMKFTEKTGEKPSFGLSDNIRDHVYPNDPGEFGRYRVWCGIPTQRSGLTAENISDAMVAIFSNGRLIEKKHALIGTDTKDKIGFTAYFTGHRLEGSSYTLGIVFNVTHGETQAQVRITGRAGTKENPVPRITTVQSPGHYDASSNDTIEDWRTFFIKSFSGTIAGQNDDIILVGFEALSFSPKDVQEMTFSVYLGGKEIAEFNTDKADPILGHKDPSRCKFRFLDVDLAPNDDYYFGVRLVTDYTGEPTEVIYREKDPSKAGSFAIWGHRPLVNNAPPDR